MRIIPLLALFSLAAAPAAAQGIVVPVRCEGDCPANGRLPRTLSLDTVRTSANLQRGRAVTYVDHLIRNETAGTLDAAFFFPIPSDATMNSVSVYLNGETTQYGEFSGREESRWVAEGIMRERADAGLRAYAGTALVHVPVRGIPPHGVRWLKIAYEQTLPLQDGTYAYRYPLSAAARAAPMGDWALDASVTTDAGFRDLRSPSHAVNVEWGTELGPCPPTSRCGSMSVPSRRVKEVRFQGGRDAWRRDFVLVYTPAGPADGLGAVPVP